MAVESPTAVRWLAGGGGQRIEAGAHQALLRIPVEITAERVRLELDATVELTEWTSQIRVEITDEAGPPVVMSLLRSRARASQGVIGAHGDWSCRPLV